jgi:hypothetical protein
VRRRFAQETRGLGKAGAATVAATQDYYQDNPVLYAQMSELLEDLYEEFGERARHIAGNARSVLLRTIRDEEKRIADGGTYEPPTFYEVNSACRHQFGDEFARAAECLYVTPSQATQEPLQQRRVS